MKERELIRPETFSILKGKILASKYSEIKICTYGPLALQKK